MHEGRKTILSGLPAELEEELESLAGALIPAGTPDGARYRLERVLGRGALFVTFRATRIDARGAVPHAVKVLRPSLARAWPAGAKLLSREQAKVLAILNDRVPPSPHVVRLLEIGELEEGTRGVDTRVPWFALEAIDAASPGGASLFHLVRDAVTATGVALDPRTALELLRGVARGLDWIHQHGLLHRGLSPSNVLVSGDGAHAIAKISDVAIARPAGLPATFGLDAPHAAARASGAALSSEAYRAPEQHDPRAPLGPSCDVHAFGGLVRFALTGRGPMSRPSGGDPPLGACSSLHPAFDRSRDAAALAALDGAIFLSRASDPDARPPTAESAWSSFEVPLRQIAERARAWAPGASATGRRVAQGPARTGSQPALVWTERHRPERPRRFSRISADGDGHALALEDGAPWWFDGRAWRAVPVDLAKATAVATAAPGRFVVGGRTSRGGARVVRVSADGLEPLFEGEGAVVALFANEDDAFAAVRSGATFALVDPRGRVELEGVAAIEAIAPLDDGAWLLVGESVGGMPWLAVFDADARLVRPQPSPRATRLLAAAAAGRPHDPSPGGCGAWVVGAHGTAILVQPVAGSAARVRLAREQVPTHDDVTAIAVDASGVAWCAAGPAVHRREARRDGIADAWVSVFRDDEVSAPIGALLPRRASVQAFVMDGTVLEGRTFGA